MSGNDATTLAGDGSAEKRTIALAVTGSIAAYKAIEVARLLIKGGHRVLPMMTTSGARFVGPVTLSGICGEKVAMEMWDPTFSGEMHVTIADRSDVLAIVPATSDMLARLAEGRADDLVTATALCARGPVLVAPAMHPRMWSHPATQHNVARLRELGRVHFVGPVHGPVASGDVGMGRLAEPADIVEAILGLARAHASDASPAHAPPSRAPSDDLRGKRVVITAGPTYEPLDPVRFLGNRSSGKMGFAIAERAAARGAEVVLIAGPVTLATPARVAARHDVETAEQMRAALAEALGPALDRADALVMSAAVADFRPAAVASGKIKKGDKEDAPTIALAKNPDLLAEIGARRDGAKKPVLVGFALETGGDDAVLEYAKKKLTAKKVDIIVANAAHESLGKVENRVSVVDLASASPFVSASKHALADLILDHVRALF